MNCKLIIIIGTLLIPFWSSGQGQSVDSLYINLSTSDSDSKKYQAYVRLYLYYNMHNRDSALQYCDQRISIAKKNNDKLAEANALAHKSFQLNVFGHYGEALECLITALEIAEDPANEKSSLEFINSINGKHNRLKTLHNVHYHFGHLLGSTLDRKEQIYHYKIADKLAKEIAYQQGMFFSNLSLGRVYMEEDKLDSALVYLFEAEKYSDAKHDFNGALYHQIGKIYYLKNNSVKAKWYLNKGVQMSKKENNLTTLIRNYYELTNIFLSEGTKDSSLFYAKQSLIVSNLMGNAIYTGYDFGMIYKNMYQAYDLINQRDSTHKYLQLALSATDSIQKVKIINLAEFQKINISQKLRLLELEREQVRRESKFRMYMAIASMVILVIISFVYYRVIAIKQQASIRLQKAYSELKSTQHQLIQSEKMASLGELTAGIAHEIQNPLNFVNNFSEVSAELVKEMVDEVESGNTEELKSIANDVVQNLERINHHGKRAAEIVKSMLQHSRSSSGVKEPTDINAVTNEYLRLAYNGIKAKDKSFNATLNTDYDQTIGNINIIPQDIGRVILNLINNAFYAVAEKKKQVGDGFEPTVSVSTKKENNKVLISVKDNGNGIPQKILDKIFQPFFTTKPTGQGTGLGLSLAYDIVSKGHGGTIEVESEEGVGTEFIIQLPIS